MWMGERTKSVLAATLSFAAVFFVWHAATAWWGVPSYVIPSLPELGQSAYAGLVEGTLYGHIGFTLGSTAVGLLIGAVAGFVVGVVVAEVPALERAVYPIVAGIQSVPKVALAPLIIVYFGLGAGSKIFTVALLVFFPIFVNTVAGLKSVDVELVALFRTLSASRLHVLSQVKIPAAAPAIFSGMKIAVVVGLIGCITSEFVASMQGIGFIIKSRAGELDVSLMFVCILILSACGAGAIYLVEILERRFVFWTRDAAAGDAGR
ncbi:MAG TPA: ABC transporter permease [Zeimonas sp.]|nr:ABC transporter permease [Zeimonas sp.]